MSIKKLTRFQKSHLNGLLGLQDDNFDSVINFEETKDDRDSREILQAKQTEDQLKNYWDSKMLDAWYWCLINNTQNVIF